MYGDVLQFRFSPLGLTGFIVLVIHQSWTGIFIILIGVVVLDNGVNSGNECCRRQRSREEQQVWPTAASCTWQDLQG